MGVSARPFGQYKRMIAKVENEIAKERAFEKKKSAKEPKKKNEEE